MATKIRAGEFKKLTSVLIARHGKLVYEGYFDGDANTLRNPRSATKSVTGVIVGIAVDAKKLGDVKTQRVFDILPERAKKAAAMPPVSGAVAVPGGGLDPRKQKITVEDLLTMSSALECDDWNDHSRGNEEKMYIVEDWAQFILDLPVRGMMQSGNGQPKADQVPYGRAWPYSYCTGGVFTLSEIIAKATGQRTDLYAQQKLFAPLGIKNALWLYSPLGVPMTGGGLSLTSRDLLKFPQLYLNGGTWNGQRLVSAEWVKASITPHAKIDDDTNYGYLWWLKSYAPPGGKKYATYFMTGNGGNKMYAIPELDMVVAITATNYGQRDMHTLAEKIFTDYVLASVEK